MKQVMGSLPLFIGENTSLVRNHCTEMKKTNDDTYEDYPFPDKPTLWQTFGTVALPLIFILGIWKLVEILGRLL